VLRLAARYSSKGTLPEGLNYWQMLLKTGKATLEDRQEYARFAQQLTRSDLADEIIQDLLVRDAENRDTRLIVLRTSMRRWATGAWSSRGRKPCGRRRPNDPYLQFILARAYLNSGAPELGSKAADLLRSLAATNGSQQLPALRTLASMFGPSPKEQADIADRLANATNIIADQILAWDVRLRLDPAHLAELEQKAASLRTGLGTNDLVVAAEWFRGRRRPDLVHQLVPPTLASKSPVAAAGPVRNAGR
jgi:predicted Zn-dependent protease